MNRSEKDTEQNAARASYFESPGYLYSVLDSLFDKVFPLFLVLAGLTVSLSLYRGLMQPVWFPDSLLHIGAYLAAMAIFLFRRRLSTIAISTMLLTLGFIVDVQSLFHFGFSGAGVLRLSALCAFAGVFLGVRAGMVAFTIVALTIGFVGTAISHGIIIPKVEAAKYMVSSMNWIMVLVCTVMYVVPLILAVNGLRRKMAQSMERLRTNNRQLEEEVARRKQAEQGLREGESRLRQIIDLVPHFIFAKDGQGRFILANEAVARAFGLTVDEMVGKTDAEINPHEGLAEQFKNEDAEILRSGMPKIIPERRVKGPDGDQRILQSIKIPYTVFPSGDRAVLGVTTDITDIKRAEELLEEKERRFRELADALPQMVVEFKEDGTITFTNLNGFVSLRYPRSDTTEGCTVYDVVIPEDRERLRADVQHMLDGIGPVFHEYTCLRSDGSTFPVHAYVATTVREKKPVSFRAIVIDMSEQKSAEEERGRLESQLRQAQKMEAVGILAGGIAHDFNNILTVLMGFGSLLRAKMDDDDPRKTYIRRILASSERAAGLTKSLLAFSRKQKIDLRPTKVNDVVLDTSKFLMRLLTEDIELRTVLTAENPTVMADTTQVGQILMNLATNARDAMPGGGTLSIETKVTVIGNPFIEKHGYGAPGAYVLILASDTGTGMDKDTVDHIFEPFFTTKGVGKGTGLGLSSVYGIVKQHGGYITVTSEFGRGTTFAVYLPIVDRREEHIVPVIPVIKGGTETVLIAEDDQNVREFMAEILQGHGYRTIEASDGDEAVRILVEYHGRIDLALIDVVMPRRNGREVYEEATQIDPNVKVLFTSGYSTDTVLERGVHDGVFDFIAKPLLPEGLLLKVRQILDR